MQVGLRIFLTNKFIWLEFSIRITQPK